MKAADMHCDTISRLYKLCREGKTEESLYSNSGHIDLCRLKEGNVFLQNFALFVNAKEAENPLEEVLGMADFYERELNSNSDLIAPVFCFSDILKNREAGKISALLTVEEGAVCRGELAILRHLYRLGVRLMTLTWNYPNEIGSPNLRLEEYNTGLWQGEKPFYLIPETKRGLTKRGIEFVQEMERIGMIIDVSHLSDAGFYDVMKHTKKPFCASHSNAREVCAWVRNLTDDMIRRLAERGGMIGLNFCPDFLTEASSGKPNSGTIEAIVAHARHITRIGGIDCLGLGSDFDGIEAHEELPDCSYLPRLESALRKAGFTASETEKIFGGNVLSFYKELL